jgi:hypothetical protein
MTKAFQRVQKDITFSLVVCSLALTSVWVASPSFAQTPAGCKTDPNQTGGPTGEFTPDGTPAKCGCPVNYSLMGITPNKTCKPNNLYNDFIQDSTNEYFPYCGNNRVAVDSNLYGSNLSSSFVPKTITQTTAYDGSLYKYTYNNLSKDTPQYAYFGASPTLLHCACTNVSYDSTVNATANGSTTTAVSLPYTANGTTPRFPTDLYPTIANTKTGAIPAAGYGPVAIALDSSKNGRLGSLFGTQQAQCGCPNFNEVMTTVVSGDKYATGAQCASLITGQNNQFAVLQNYNATVNDSLILNKSTEPHSANGALVTSILLPTDNSYSKFQPYARRVWTCADPLSFTSADGAVARAMGCAFNAARHSCGAGNGSGSTSGSSAIQDSAVSSTVTGKSTTLRFANTVNKKLACCSNDQNSTDTYLKYDCVDNSTNSYLNFDALWNSSDDSVDGGQTNALALAGGQGSPITGFYTPDGNRCNQFSEFAGLITPGVVAAKSNYSITAPTSGSANNGGVQALPILFPPNGSGAQALIADARSKNKTIPDGDDRTKCPILVRAALKVSCPTAIYNLPTRLPAYVDDSKKIHCSSAQNIEVHLRIEQIWQVAGQSVIKSVDTILDANNPYGPFTAGKLDISQLTMLKNGSVCPPGTTREYGTLNCSY